MKIKNLACIAIVISMFLSSWNVLPALSANNTMSDGTTMNDNSTVVTEELSTEGGWWPNQPKENKLLYSNIAAATIIGLYGLSEWDYGSASFHSADEGWFDSDSKYGGADKMGHFWSTYAFSDALTGLYKHWGYDSGRANAYGAISAWTVQFAMELFDATSETQGFSWEDVVINTLGSLTSVLMEKFPALDRKIDFRVEYIFNVEINNIFDDYSNQFYSMVLKLDGFDSLENIFLIKYLELHGGYYSRGYDTDEVDKNRAVYAGISLNFSRFFHQNGWRKTGKVLEYIQIPYTVPKVSHKL